MNIKDLGMIYKKKSQEVIKQKTQNPDNVVHSNL